MHSKQKMVTINKQHQPSIHHKKYCLNFWFITASGKRNLSCHMMVHYL